VYTLDGRARIPARFAIDWVKLAEDATHARGDAKSIANWHGDGAEVLPSPMALSPMRSTT
jgi:hypothetical protein